MTYPIRFFFPFCPFQAKVLGLKWKLKPKKGKKVVMFVPRNGLLGKKVLTLGNC